MLTFFVGIVPLILSPKMFKKQDGKLAFFAGAVLPISTPKLFKKHNGMLVFCWCGASDSSSKRFKTQNEMLAFFNQKFWTQEPNPSKLVPFWSGGVPPWKHVLCLETASNWNDTFACFANASHVHLGPPAGPVGETFGPFSFLGRSWDVQMAVLAGVPFWRHFLFRILIRTARLGNRKLDYSF